ncbi:putative FBD domain-containing protein [Rosa chinensis]|uniref:Putative FBD domain-containing protein n=1 Tax=Rosa chinensis TaxID=74649 RepID=A0A2P6PZ10_ROSCH|nr:putative FBD domain-containing protein [Rosa chinensis]
MRTKLFPLMQLAKVISIYYSREMQIKQAPKCSHEYLRVVEVAEYHGRTSDFELVMYLIENAVELEKLVIRPVGTWYSYDRRMQYDGNAEREEKAERKQATQQLKEQMPSTLDFICRL